MKRCPLHVRGRGYRRIKIRKRLPDHLSFPLPLLPLQVYGRRFPVDLYVIIMLITTHPTRMNTLHAHRTSVHPPQANVNATTLHLTGHTGHPRAILRVHRALPPPGVPRDDMITSLPRPPTVLRLLLLIMTHRRPLLLPPRRHAGTALPAAPGPKYYNNGYWTSPPLLWPFPILL
jgi:hypothetical protein